MPTYIHILIVCSRSRCRWLLYMRMRYSLRQPHNGNGIALLGDKIAA